MDEANVRAAVDDELLFAEEAPRQEEVPQEVWKLLIVDDEEDVHAVTRLVLQDYEFEGRRLELLSAYSGQEAEALLREHADIAVMLLDVVMETDRSGLDLVRFIRDDLRNRMVRIILRTGQPGQAPEKKVIIEYDINDYKEKTELTAQKLVTAVTAALRSFRDLRIIEQSRRGLEQILDASTGLFELQSLKQFVSGVLRQLTALLHLKESSFYLQISSFAATPQPGNGYRVLAATGEFESSVGHALKEVLPVEVLEDVELAVREKRCLFLDRAYVGYFCTSNGSENLLYVQGGQQLSELDKDLLRIFSANVAIAFDNIYLHEENLNTQKEFVFALGETIETRSRETGNHVRRVAEYCRRLAELAGLSEEDTQLVWMIAPMHDLGKIGIPDAILGKPGPLSEPEFELIKSHTTIGHSILKATNCRVLNVAATVALEHHEHWDGTGYPRGVAGDEIHLFGRIVALADVFDALGCERVYKAPWPEEKILAYLKAERGRQFDPSLVDLFLANVTDFTSIRKNHPD